jgi:hypothetical protein
MKKLLLILFIWISVLSFNNKTYSHESYENKVCEFIKLKKNESKICYKKHYIIEDYDNIISYIYDNKWKLLLKINNVLGSDFFWYSFFIYEWKYWNHIYVDNSYIIKNSKDFWIYIDNKKISGYFLKTEKYRYKSLWDFAKRNWIVAYDYNKDYIWKKDEDGIYLSERTRLKLDNFVQKVEKIKYPKEKLLKKLEILYKKYEWKKWYKAKFYKEVITYVYIEILINKLKQSDKLEKINFYY